MRAAGSVGRQAVLAQDGTTDSEHVKSNDVHSILTSTKPSSGDASNDKRHNDDLVHIYSVRDWATATSGDVSNPFIAYIEILNEETGEIVRVKGLVDDGAMVNVMDETLWKHVQARLRTAAPSLRRLRMANGAVVLSHGRWTGTFRLGRVKARSSFEIFPSGGAWSFLIGKPMLEALHAIHDYKNDVISVSNEGMQDLVKNAYARCLGDRALRAAGVSLTLDIKMLSISSSQIATEIDYADGVPMQIPLSPEPQRSTSTASIEEVADAEGVTRTLRPLPVHDACNMVIDTDSKDDHNTSVNIPQEHGETSPVLNDAEPSTVTGDKQQMKSQRAKIKTVKIRVVWAAGRRQWRIARRRKLVRNTALNAKHDTTRYIGLDAPEGSDEDLCELPVFSVDTPSRHANSNLDILTRANDPFKKERVNAIVEAVQLGDDLSEQEQTQVRNLIAEYADCFALSIKEVLPVPGAVHTLNVPENTTFSRKIHQRPLTPPQRKYVYEKIDELLDAGVIEPCNPSQVKCVAPITLAHKAHEGEGLTLEELRRRVNEQCDNAGLPKAFEVDARPKDDTRPDPPPFERKWRICQNFTEINRVTEIAPMPQGDIRMKQQRLSGHRWVSTFDFASGFYAVTVAEESRPYTCFYIEGRGYFWCVKMPFGLTGAPSTFAHMTATHLHDLLKDGTMELFVDDGATAGDEFPDLMGKTRRILDRVRASKLSLSPSKSRFFMTTTVFAGGKVGPQGVSPDQAKLTAIVDWERPDNALNLSSFLGLTGHFRDLIKDYARIEGPLRNILRNIPGLKAGLSKMTYRRTLQNFKLSGTWSTEHEAAFIKLKTVLTEEPVLRNPKWDGSPFIITTDGCKDGFGAVLSQRFQHTLPSGRTIQKVHPIAFASKRTSTTEEKYKPFILEFAALKFALDKFADIVWGFPVELETDCQALRDMLTNDKLSTAHERWRDGILAHNIVDVRHIPGKINTVADGLSRKGEGTPRQHQKFPKTLQRLEQTFADDCR